MSLSKENCIISKIILRVLSLVFCIRIFKLCGRLYAAYPLNNDAKKWEIYLDNLIWYFFHVNFWILAIATILAVYKSRFNVSAMLTSSMELIIIFEILAVMIFYKLRKTRLQVLLKISENYIIFGSKHRLRIMRKFSIKYLVIFGVIGILYSITAFIYLYRSFTSNQLLASGYYPCASKSQLAWIFVYIHHLIAIGYAPAIIYVDCIVTGLIFIATVRLHLLKTQFKNTELYFQLVKCIQKHQSIIWFAKETDSVISLFILKSFISSAVFLISGGLKFFTSDVSLLIRSQFVTLFIIALMRIYLYSYCAERLTTSGYELGFSIYSSLWYTQKRRIVTAKSIVIFRCQKSLSISVSQIIPSLGMKYLSHFLYLIVSYVMTLRAVAKI